MAATILYVEIEPYLFKAAQIAYNHRTTGKDGTAMCQNMSKHVRSDVRRSKAISLSKHIQLLLLYSKDCPQPIVSISVVFYNICTTENGN